MTTRTWPVGRQRDQDRIAKLIRLAGGPKALLTELLDRGGKQSASKPGMYAWQKAGKVPPYRRQMLFDILWDRRQVLQKQIAEIQRFLDKEFDQI